MATKTFNTRIANKRDTSANWTSNNPVLLNGEIIIVDTEAGQVRYKVGNGTSTYTQLPFTDESLITNINGKLSLSGGTMTGNINMGGHKLTDLGAPVNSNDAVRQADLKVVSDEVDGIISGTTGITLAPATTTKIGGVIVGDGIEVEADGTISTNPVPTGGTAGQVLTRTADGSAWEDAPSGLPDGGTEGQMLYKAADGAEWGNPVGKADQNSLDSTGEIFNDYERNEATGEYSHAEGWMVIASGSSSHAEGDGVEASGYASHAEGMLTTASGDEAHSEGSNTVASGDRSHAEGQRTVASGKNQHVQGKYNIEDNSDTYAHIVGNGNSANTRSNAHTLDWDGNAWFSGDVFVGGSSQTSGDKLMKEPTGTAGQLLGFTADNTVGAVDAPESGLTQDQADERYLQLTGGDDRSGRHGFGSINAEKYKIAGVNWGCLQIPIFKFRNR